MVNLPNITNNEVTDRSPPTIKSFRIFDKLSPFLAQLGERQTEDLQVLGSIPREGNDMIKITLYGLRHYLLDVKLKVFSQNNFPLLISVLTVWNNSHHLVRL